MDQSIKFVCLNIEGDKHLSLIKPFLTSVQSEVIFLQEVFKHTAESLAELLHMEYVYVPMCTRTVSDKEEGEFLEWGIAIFSKYPLHNVQITYYGVDYEKKIPQFKRDANGGPLIMPSRVLLSGTIEKNGQSFHLATTHFTWTPDGQDSELQHKDLASLLNVLADKEQLILAGDFNAPRGGVICKRLCESFTYWIPPTVTSTLDPNLHRVKNLEYVVDHLFTRGNYLIENVTVVDGVSDHKAIMANVIRPIINSDEVILAQSPARNISN